LGRDPVIASLSLGEERVFQIKHNTNKEVKRSIILQHGSLLVMKNGAQIHYKHQIPKASKSKKPRINLTFRNIT
jgi:alkylated DNA repair dioxygenase AlkB